MTSTMTVSVRTPGETRRIDDVAHARIEVTDGARGIQPGHEPARAQLEPGVLELRLSRGDCRFIATEGGLVSIGRAEIEVLTDWASSADDLETLARQVAAREQARAQARQAARALVRRHEFATRRVLALLRREVGQ